MAVLMAVSSVPLNSTFFYLVIYYCVLSDFFSSLLFEAAKMRRIFVRKVEATNFRISTIDSL